uniref:Sodium- and chloride-dependent GABA transporter 1-like n=1 Tax=Phallusia mammillata TaxID=59560 RepID=A0A6F9DTF7_9ASCI|nr:sodium- and chloride-dependent GABA transporter 1-like [Phallusia mammillata]
MSSEFASILPNEKPPKTFKSSLGVALSCLGAAVGTGNIWRYPRIVANNTGENGALAFLLIWFLFLFTWSIPLLLVEYGAGRYTKCATILTFKKMVGPKAMWCGAFIGFVNFAIASYYAVICGWCAYYFVYFIANELPSTSKESTAIFMNFAEESAWPVLFQAIVIVFGSICVFAGVRSIEPVMMIMVPALLCLMFASFVYSLTLEYSSIGIKHLFNMDWEVFKNPKTWIEALTQNAWDTGAAQGVLLVYATYLGKEHGVVRYGTVIPTINNFLSFLMAITMFSTIFSVQISMNPSITVNQILDSFASNAPGNTGLTFIWIPLLYSSLSIGRAVTILFFLCLFLAGFSSQISLIEASCHQLVDLKVPRKIAVPIIGVLMFLLGLGSTLNVYFLVNQDFVWGSAIVVSGSLLLFLVYAFGVSKFRREVINGYGDGSDWTLPRLWEWIIYILIPFQIVAIFVWWVISNVMDKDHLWYEITEESLLSALVQWAVVLIILVIFCFLYIRYAEKILPSSYVLPGLGVTLPAVSRMTQSELTAAVDLELEHFDNPLAQDAALPGNT